jgi:hypothetical protein
MSVDQDDRRHIRIVERGKPERIERDGVEAWVHVPFEATFTWERGELEVTFSADVVDGEIQCSEVRTKGADLGRRMTSVVRGVPFRELFEVAARLVTYEPVDPDYKGVTVSYAGGPQMREASADSTAADVAAASASGRTRSELTDKRLTDVATAYQTHKGDEQAIAKALSVGKRQMWRLVKTARERGFLAEEV